MKREWWHSLTVYQIYTRSFCDSNGDGIGDFGGILQKLDYLQELGVGAIWLSPFNDSPNYDNGYDVSDYYKVMEEAGTMEELEELIAACEKREIVVMMDLVLNHSSHLHPWFLEARKDRNSKYHDFYIWKEGRNEGAAARRRRSILWRKHLGMGAGSSGILLSQFQCNAAGSELEKSVASERAVPDDPVLDG